MRLAASSSLATGRPFSRPTLSVNAPLKSILPFMAPAVSRDDDSVQGGHGNACRRPIEGDVAGNIGRQPVGRAHRGALGAQYVDGASDRAVVQRRMGGAGDQDKDV